MLKIGTLLQQYEREANSLGSDIMNKDIVRNPNVINNDEHHNQCSYTGTSLKNKRIHDHLCTERACIIYFYLYPFMGYKSLNLTAKRLSVNRTILMGWLEKKNMILIWLPIVE